MHTYPNQNDHILAEKISPQVKKCLICFVLLLVVGFNIQFVIRFPSLFYAPHWNWQKETELETLGDTKILKITSKNLTVAPLDPHKLNPDFTYKLQDSRKKSYYFRYEYAKVQNDTVTFYDVYWLKGMPKFSEAKVQFIRTRLPIVTHGKFSAVTLGDKMVSRGKSEKFRALLSQKASLEFTGSHTDELGLRYEGGVHTTVAELSRLADTLSPAQYYFVMISDTSEKENTSEQLMDLIKKLQKKHPQKIFVLAPEPLKNNVQWKNFLAENSHVIWVNTKGYEPFDAPYEKWAETLLKHLP